MLYLYLARFRCIIVSRSMDDKGKSFEVNTGPFRVPLVPNRCYRFALDAKAQLSGCAEDFVSVGGGLANKLVEAGFGSYKSAHMAATFDMTYPTIMVKPSLKAEDVSHGGYCFTPPFATRTSETDL